ncbi:MAG: serine/threonine protein kinase, partial [Deltaproteobacteria bacterium]
MILKFGRYEILEEIGKGSMGVVYRAHDPQIDRIIALKVLRHDRMISEDFVQRFLKEAKAIGRLSHPAIVTVYDVGEDKGTVYLAMEFLEGTSLDRIIHEKKLSLEEIVDMGVQAAEALDYAHQHGVVHRDIKPANIILTPTGQVKITDFGIARIEDPSATRQTQAGEILGTPSYMSPEQVMSRSVDGRSDLYSLGVILYELATGERPFEGNNMAATFRAITQDTPVEPAKIDPTVSQALSALVMKSLNKPPDSRFQTGSSMAESLKACFKEGEFRPPETPATKKSKYRGLLALVTVMVIGIAGGFYYYYTKTELPSQPKEPPVIHKDEAAVEEKVPEDIREEDKPVVAEQAAEKTAKQAAKQPAEQVVKTALQALLEVDSKPSGAQVYIDDALEGETPLQFDLTVGKHEIRLLLQDHHDWEAPLLIE